MTINRRPQDRENPAHEHAESAGRARIRGNIVEALLAIQQALTHDADLDANLQLIAEKAREVTGAAFALVDVVEEDALRMVAFAGEDRSFVEAFPDSYRLSIEDSAVGQAIRERRLIHLEDTANLTGSNPDAVARLQARNALFRSAIVAPLIAESEPIGLIVVADPSPHAFSKEDERILSTLAASAELALENARRYQREQERRQVAEGLRTTLSLLNSARSQQEMLDHIVAEAIRLLDSSGGAIYLLDEDGQRLSVEASTGLAREYTELDIPLGNLISGRAAEMKEPVAVPDIPAARAELKWYAEQPGNPAGWHENVDWLAATFGALLSVPIKTPERVFGVLTLYYDEPRFHTDDEIALALAFADQTALVLETERLRKQVTTAAALAERHRLARDLHDAVTQTLFSAGMIAEVLPDLLEANPEEGRRRLQQLRRLTRSAQAEMRSLLMQLRPASFSDVSLKQLMQQLGDAAAGRTDARVEVDVQGVCEVGADVREAFYYVAQEALNNAIKHADASRITVRATCRADRIVLQVMDSGTGFDTSIRKGGHFGLGIMQERADEIGARLNVSSFPGEGTTVTLIWSEDNHSMR